MVSTVANPVLRTTDAQIVALTKLGVSTPPALRSEASRLITQLRTERDMAAPTSPQLGRAAALGGRDLPGVRRREISAQIALLEALALLDAAENDEQRLQATELLVERARYRFQKPLTVRLPAPTAQAADEA